MCCSFRQRGHVSSRALLQQNPPVLNCACLVTDADLFNGREIVVHHYTDDWYLLSRRNYWSTTNATNIKYRGIQKVHTQSAKYSSKNAWPAKHDNNSSAVSGSSLLTSDKECPEAGSNDGSDGILNGRRLPDLNDFCDRPLGTWTNGDGFSSACVTEISSSNDDTTLICKHTTASVPPAKHLPFYLLEKNLAVVGKLRCQMATCFVISQLQ